MLKYLKHQNIAKLKNRKILALRATVTLNGTIVSIWDRIKHRRRWFRNSSTVVFWGGLIALLGHLSCSLQTCASKIFS